ncbi:MAG: glycosyltransferase, partial [Catenulispora sp.]|nr:glycosyltransferase [Catenulispora sp.]
SKGSTALSAFSGPAPEDLPGLPGTAEFLTVSHACASVAFGLLLARDWLTAGLVDAALLVGATFLNPCEYAGMDVTRALSATGLRPFDEDRDGTCLGEGAGAVVLERAADAARRGHTPLATVAGGNVRISPEAGAASDLGTVEACLAAALAEAGDPSVDYVHAHATGTPQGDLVELQALQHLAAEYAWTGVPVGSHKGGVGHLMQSISVGGLPGPRGGGDEPAYRGGSGVARPRPADPGGGPAAVAAHVRGAARAYGPGRLVRLRGQHRRPRPVGGRALMSRPLATGKPLITGGPLVTVVTPTKGRPSALLRAAASVVAQEGVRVEHIIVGDDCPALADPAFRAELSDRFPAALVVNVSPATHPDVPMDYLPARLAYLRNLGIARAAGEYVGQLDDDNVLRPDHLRTLIDALESHPGAEAAHSWRRLIGADGKPFVPDGADPWHPDPAARAESYERLRAAGVFVPGSPVVRDTLQANGKIYARVDTSEYLVRRSLHERIPFPTTFNRYQRKLGLTEDMAFSHALIRAGIVVACSRAATLDYHLGGYSNVDAVSNPEPKELVA